MLEVSFPSIEGVDVDNSIEGSHISSLDTIETLIGRGVNEVDSLTSHDEEAGSPLKGKQECLGSNPIGSKESRLDVDGNDVETLMTDEEEVEATS